MTIEIVREVLGWSALINYALLTVWFLIFSWAHNWLYGFHGKWFTLPVEKFDAIHYAAMAFYKLAIFMLNLVPYIALRIAV